MAVRPETLIRLATEDDAPAIAEIHVEGWQAAYRHIFPPEAFENRNVATREREFRDFLSNPGPEDRIWVAELEGGVAGFAYTRAGLDTGIALGGELKLFYVRPELRGSGVGLPLFEHAIADLEARGLQPYLYTLRDNAAARAWYERRGWRHDGAESPWSDRGEYPEITEVRYRPASPA
jgi:GNAT superfamily N-acetyltransferase